MAVRGLGNCSGLERVTKNAHTKLQLIEQEVEDGEENFQARLICNLL